MNDMDNKVSPCALLVDAQGDTLFYGNLTHFKTRGNKTFKEKKKPFAIKFPEKQFLHGLDGSKSFVLLANYGDESHIRNAIGLDLAYAMGIPAPRYVYLTLYVNNTYWGLYQMTNKVDVGKNALNISNLDKRNKWANPKPIKEYEWYGSGRKKQVVQRKGVLLENDPGDITGGYLLDITGPPQAYNKSVSGFVSDAGDNIRIRSPKYASPREVDYIAERYNEMEGSILAPNGIHPETGRHYSEYIDSESFARYYLLNELLWNVDGGYASFMMYKDSDSIDPKFYAGPAWDYDRILNNPVFMLNTVAFANEFYADKKKEKVGITNSGGLLYYLCKHEGFRQTVRNCYLNEISAACHCYLDGNRLDSLVSLLSDEADQDNLKYETRCSEDYESATTKVISFLRDRLAFLDWYYSSSDEEHVVVYYRRPNNVYRKFCFPTGEPVNAPQLTKVMYNYDPICSLYYPGTDSVVPDGTVFHSSQDLELRYRKPTDKEVRTRRIKKKLAKIGLDF